MLLRDHYYSANKWRIVEIKKFSIGAGTTAVLVPKRLCLVVSSRSVRRQPEKLGRRWFLWFWAKIWRFWGINKGSKLNLFYNPKKMHRPLLDFTSVELLCVKIHQHFWPVGKSEKKGINCAHCFFPCIVFHRCQWPSGPSVSNKWNGMEINK